MADDGDAPRSAQEPLPCQSAHVGHVRIVDREAKDPDGGEQSATKPPGGDGQTGKTQDTLFLRFPSLLELREGVGQVSVAYLSISVHHSMSSFSFMKTGKCWSLPCLMELDLVVMVLTLSNCKEGETLVHECVRAIKKPQMILH